MYASTSILCTCTHNSVYTFTYISNSTSTFVLASTLISNPLLLVHTFLHMLLCVCVLVFVFVFILGYDDFVFISGSYGILWDNMGYSGTLWYLTVREHHLNSNTALVFKHCQLLTRCSCHCVFYKTKVEVEFEI